MNEYNRLYVLPGGVGGFNGSDRVVYACGCTGADKLNTSEADNCLSRLDLPLALGLTFEGAPTALVLEVMMDPPTMILLLLLLLEMLLLPTIDLCRDDDDDDEDGVDASGIALNVCWLE